MYMPQPAGRDPDVIQALDGTGDVLWEYGRSLPEDVDEFLITVLAEISRNLSIYDTALLETWLQGSRRRRDQTQVTHVVAIDLIQRTVAAGVECGICRHRCAPR